MTVELFTLAIKSALLGLQMLFHTITTSPATPQEPPPAPPAMVNYSGSVNTPMK